MIERSSAANPSLQTFRPATPYTRMDIRLLDREELDRLLYDSCVHYAANGTFFGYAWMLDQLSRDWQALVEVENEKYVSVLPLPRGRAFWRQPALLQPELIREIGIYSVKPMSPGRVRGFWKRLPEEYAYVDLRVEPRSKPLPTFSLEAAELDNYYLLLNRPYEELAAAAGPAYESRRDAVQEQGDLFPISGPKPEVLADLYQEIHGADDTGGENFHGLQRVMYQVLHRGIGFAAGVSDRAGKLLAAAFFIYSHGQVVALLDLESPAGRAQDARLLLYDNFLRTHADRPLALDLNSPDKEWAALLGAEHQPYYRLLRDERIGIYKSFGKFA